MSDERPATLTVARPEPTDRRPPAGRRVGYVIAIAVNAVMLWLVHQLLGWGWPGFLTDDFDAVVPWLSVSFGAGIVANACFISRDRGWFRSLADLTTAAIGLLVSVQMWKVFPFDFAGYDHDWSWVFRLGIVVGVVGSSIGMITNAVKLIRDVGGVTDPADTEE
jgi:hypothetical protein